MGLLHSFTSIILGGIMLSSFQQAQAERGSPIVQFRGATIDEMIGTFMQTHDIPGMTLAIVQAPYVSRVVGYGVSNGENKLLASPNTLWNVGQLTCAFTSVALMQLLEDNKLLLDDSVGKYIPDLPSAWQAITLRQLMGQTSGLPDYTQQANFESYKEYKPEEILALIKQAPLNFPPGSQVSQSATNFFLLGLVIEKASGMSYESYVTKNQIERLGLKHTYFLSEISKIKQEDVANQQFRHKEFLNERVFINPAEMAMGYTGEDGKVVPVKMNSQGALYANGGIISTAEELSVWDIALAGNILVKKKENRETIYSAVTLNDGTKVQANGGWRFYGHKGLMSMHGNVPGFSCYMSRFTDPAELLCVTICANKDNVDLTELARLIAGAFDNKLGTPKGPSKIRCFESCFSVQTTVERLESFLKKKGIQVMAKIDHSAGASKANLSLKPTETLIFGNPAMGTHLMLANQAIAIDLPLRVAVWEEENGSVWLGHDDIRLLAESYGITGPESTIEQMRRGLAASVSYAIEPF